MRGNLLGDARNAGADVLLVDNHAAARVARRPSSDNSNSPDPPSSTYSPTRPPQVRCGAA